MSQPRFQIFVSSTFRDLEKERGAVLNAILKLNQFPAGMEIFPAANDTPWEMIEKIIKESDYYVLIIGGKYGSMDETGISYTEKEYDFAVSQRIPVLTFIHSQPGKIEADKTEQNARVRKKLEAFKKKVGKHHCNYWKSIDELKANVLSSLSMAFVMNPQTGWVKAGGIDNTELLSRLADLQKRYDDLQLEYNNLKESETSFVSSQYVFGDEKINVSFKYHGSNRLWNCEISWNDLFFALCEVVMTGCKTRDVMRALLKIIPEHFEKNSEFNIRPLAKVL